MADIYSVAQITQYIKRVLEENPVLKSVLVSGEISNVKYHSSGHVYFSVKDPSAQLTCVMFRSFAQYAPRLKEGDKLILQGDITVYMPRGNYQLMVRAVKKEGKGDLHEQFEALKAKLRKEGLFDAVHKKHIPQFPKKIAIISSPTSAALRDIVRTIYRRYDKVELILIPTVVQGLAGKGSILASLEQVEGLEADTVILARGGGSIEDLWNFNEPEVARAIFACKTPIIVGVGHETDFTIAGFVADLRASTPTAAAEHAVPDKEAILYTLEEYERQLQRGLQYFIDFKRQVLDDYAFRMEQAVMHSLEQKRHTLELLQAQLKGMDVRKLLQQGYTLTLKEGKILNTGAELKEGDQIESIFHDARIASEVQKK